MFNIINTKKGNALAWIIVILAILIILFLVLRGGDENGDNNNGDNNEDNNDAADITEEGEVASVVTYNDNGFSPAEVTIELGETVRFVNESSNREMWVASAMHPTHMVFSGTNLRDHCPDTENDDFDQCEEGETFEFTFNKVGEWAYHNHLGANHFGKVIVQ